MKKRIAIAKLAVVVLALSFASNLTLPLISQVVDKVTICHRGHTIQVPRPSLSIYLSLGDTVGPCVVTECQNR